MSDTPPDPIAPSAESNNPERESFGQREVVISGADGAESAQSWGIAVETPVEIAINGAPWTVMLATPSDVEDLAIGLALTERVLRDAAAVERVERSEYLHELSVNIIVPEAQIDREAVRARTLASGTACGLCGIESLAALTSRSAHNPRFTAAKTKVADSAVLAAFDALPAQQPINQATRSVHAAAWCALDGRILLVREDVGRHNALDKLIGAMARREMLEPPGFIVMSSRCSYELVYKAVVANTQLLATMSAPTSMALEWSEALALPLACCLRSQFSARVAHFPPHRLMLDAMYAG